MTVECKHDWANSYSINKHGTLDDVLECNICGKRTIVGEYVQSLNGKLPHLKDVSNKAYKILKEIHKPKF